MDTNNSLPQEVKHPRARRTRRPLGLADTRPQVHIYVDTPDGISDGDGRMSALDLTSAGLNFIADYSDGSYVILDVKFISPITVPADSALWIAAQNLLHELHDEDTDIPFTDKAIEALRGALAATPPPERPVADAARERLLELARLVAADYEDAADWKDARGKLQRLAVAAIAAAEGEDNDNS